MDWKGIQNEHEFYSAYFFTESLGGFLKERLDAWGKAEAEAKAEAEKAGLKTWRRAPGHQLRLDARTLLDDMHDAAEEPSVRERILAERRVILRMLDVFGLPHAAVSPEGTVEPFLPAGEDRAPLPLLGALYKDGNAAEPVVWIFEATRAGRRDLEDEEEVDPLSLTVSLKQFPETLPALTKKAEGELEDDWGKLIEKQVFGIDHPPRWVILAAVDSWVLVDRTKYGRRSVLRFNWTELLKRREEKVLDVCGALLSAESMTSTDGRVLLDEVDESAHKEAYGVSEALKKSLREAIELLGNEAAVKIVEERRRTGKAIWKNDKLAADLTLECLRYMYRILFLLFVESRKELKYAPVDNPAYQSAYSFESLRDLELVPLVTDADRKGRFIHDSISKLVSFYALGTPRVEEDGSPEAFGYGADAFTIEPLKGTLFDLERTPLLNQVVFTNETLQKVIRLMSLSRGGGARGRTGRISYAHLGINQLGAVYEALLSYRGFFAKEDLYEVHKAGEAVNEFESGYFVTKDELEHYTDEEKTFVTTESGERTLKVYPKETFIYRLTGREREKSASYYTPEVLTQCVVKYALKEYVKTVLEKLPDDHARAEKILSLRICEPAMGSAAFLNEAINQLSALYMDYAQKARNERLTQERYAVERQRVKMYLADNCVFGVDLNPVAVELAEVSLWLNALSEDRFVPWFGLQLQAGNSLIGCRRRVYEQAELGRWREVVPKDIGAEPLKKGQIWQFLMPNPGMANYTDADVKKVCGQEIKALNEKRRAFISTKFRPEEIKSMVDLSEKAEKLWQSWAKKLREVREQTTDPYPVYGHEPKAKQGKILSYKEKNDLVEAVRRGDGSADSGEFMRLRLAMNYWCALWFWPIEKADEFPSRAEFLAEMGTILTSEILGTVEMVSMTLFDDGPQCAKEDEAGRLSIDSLRDLCPHLAVSEAVAERFKFFHWPLRFADVFLPEKGGPAGFDLTFGNPPWRVVSWNSGAVVGDYLPYVTLRGESASAISKKIVEKDASGCSLLDLHPDMAAAWRAEYVEAAGMQNMFGAPEVFPDLVGGGRCNLFKCFLPLSWVNSSADGVQGFLHPMTSFTETNGMQLRRSSYERVRLLVQFANELKLFAEIHDQLKYAVAIYGKSGGVNSSVLMNVYHPKTVDESFADDGKSPVDGVKDCRGEWNIKGNLKRVVVVNGEVLSDLAEVFSDDPIAPILPNLHSQDDLYVLAKFACLPRRIGDDQRRFCVSSMWNETTARKDGIISEYGHKETRAPVRDEPVILNGPHLFVSNPFSKTPDNPCENNLSWKTVDLEFIVNDYVPRAKYYKICDWGKYQVKQPFCPGGRRFDQNWRLAYREFVGIGSERTLMSALIPPRYAHVNSVNSIAFSDVHELILVAGAFSSLPVDYYVRQIGKPHLLPNVICSLPFICYGAREMAVSSRVLSLNCLTSAYSELWSNFFNEAFSEQEWSQTPVSYEKSFFGSLTKDWTRACALRSDLMRRQALVELDVLTAQVIGLTLDELQTIYRINFTVLRSYEEDTWYDQKGRIIFTPNSLGLKGVGIPRKARTSDIKDAVTYTVNGRPCGAKGLGFEDVKDMKEGFVTKTFMDASLTDTPVERTVTYFAPFFKMDREKDYEVAWDFFMKKYGEVDVEALQGKPKEAPAADDGNDKKTSAEAAGQSGAAAKTDAPKKKRGRPRKTAVAKTEAEAPEQKAEPGPVQEAMF